MLTIISDEYQVIQQKCGHNLRKAMLWLILILMPSMYCGSYLLLLIFSKNVDIKCYIGFQLRINFRVLQSNSMLDGGVAVSCCPSAEWTEKDKNNCCKSLDAIYHSTIQFITQECCQLYEKVISSSLTPRWHQHHFYVFSCVCACGGRGGGVSAEP